MKVKSLGTLCAVVAAVTACQSNNEKSMNNPPVADQRPHTYSFHNIAVQDPYYWLKDQNYPAVDDADVLAYLKAENEYTNQYFDPMTNQVDELFTELTGRLEKNEWSVPLKDGDFYYQSRYEKDADYPTHVRWPSTSEDPLEETVAVLLDERILAESHDYFEVGSTEVSPNNRLLAYSTDSNGNERYTIYVSDISSQHNLDDEVENTFPSIIWAADSKSFYYIVADESWRPREVRRHVLGTNANEDTQIYLEDDPEFFVSISSSTSRKFFILDSSNSVSSEVYYFALGAENPNLNLIAPREPDHLYTVDHRNDEFVIQSNSRHKNFGVAIAKQSNPSKDEWKFVLEGDDQLYIEYVQSFSNYIAVRVRVNGLSQIMLLDAGMNRESVKFDEPTYIAHIGSNAEPTLEKLRISYSSLTKPRTVYDYDIQNQQLVEKKVQVVPGGFDSSMYQSERLMIAARDGVEIPVSLVYRKDLFKPNENPLFLNSYGAYGSASDPYFSTNRLSLLDRGFVYAIAHIRGGDELGFHWYEAGKLQARTNTFHDFVDVARGLIERKYTTRGRIAISGGSAGGSLMGAVANEAPELWGAVISYVPFVDILNTMLDTTLPLTPIEWSEWGNPIEDQEAFEYIRSYSPYDQLKTGAFPPMLVTAGLNDPRVTYWEPAKYVAKLRSVKTDGNTLLLKTEMAAGHAGKSGRQTALREVAEGYAFVFKEMGIAL